MSQPDRHYKRGDFNYSRASARDEIVHMGQRPGFDPTKEIPQGTAAEDLGAWCEFMKAQGVKRVLSFLNASELEWYQSPGVEAVTALHGFITTRTTVDDEGSADVALRAMKEAEAAGEKIVVHCSGGGGRAPIGAGLWLVERYGITPQEAAQELSNMAQETGTERRATPDKIAKYHTDRTMRK